MLLLKTSSHFPWGEDLLVTGHSPRKRHSVFFENLSLLSRIHDFLSFFNPSFTKSVRFHALPVEGCPLIENRRIASLRSRLRKCKDSGCPRSSCDVLRYMVIIVVATNIVKSPSVDWSYCKATMNGMVKNELEPTSSQKRLFPSVTSRNARSMSLARNLQKLSTAELHASWDKRTGSAVHFGSVIQGSTSIALLYKLLLHCCSMKLFRRLCQTSEPRHYPGNFQIRRHSTKCFGTSTILRLKRVNESKRKRSSQTREGEISDL